MLSVTLPICSEALDKQAVPPYTGLTAYWSYSQTCLRRSATVNGVTTYYVYDGTMMVREMQTSAGTGLLTPTATYFTGPSGPEYRRDDTQTETDGQGHVFGKTRWYVYDGLGSVVGEVDPVGNLTSSPKYDVYGAVRANSGTASSRQGFVGGLGHVTDAETGLVYMKARYYDPSIGRFESQDPSCNGNNWFVYASDDPINHLDPNGRASDGIDFIIKLLWNLYGPEGVDLPDGSPTEQLDNLIQFCKNQIYAGRAAATGGAVDAAEGDATENDAESAKGNLEAGAGLAQEAVAALTEEQSQLFLQYIVDMNDIIGP